MSTLTVSKSDIDAARQRAKNLIESREDVSKAEALEFIASWRGQWELEVAIDDVIRVFRAHCGIHLTREGALKALLSVHDVVRVGGLGSERVILYPVI